MLGIKIVVKEILSRQILLEELKVEGTKIAVTYKILNGDWNHSSTAVDSLEVANMKGTN